MHYYKVCIINYDENNVPYSEDVFIKSSIELRNEDIRDFCEVDLEMNFEEIKVSSCTYDEILEYVDDEDIVVYR